MTKKAAAGPIKVETGVVLQARHPLFFQNQTGQVLAKQQLVVCDFVPRRLARQLLHRQGKTGNWMPYFSNLS